MGNESLAAFLRGLELRLAGIKAHADQFAAAGVNPAWVQEGETLVATLKRLDEEQEALKAQLNAKTVELKAARQSAQQWRTRTDRRIRLIHENEPTRLIEYGL
jgi:hypothetical protein